MICTNTDHYVNTLSTVKKEKKKKTCPITPFYFAYFEIPSFK